jgi:opacity protein-like surface antigen
MKRFTILAAMFVALLFTAQMASAQMGGGGGTFGGGGGGDVHLYPDTYPGDDYSLNNPAALGVAYIDRTELDDYPLVIFTSSVDYYESIDFEEATLRVHFPLGVNLAYYEVDDDGFATEFKYVFEPTADQFLFENDAELQLFSSFNPNSLAYFGHFWQAQKQVRKQIGWVYVVFVDTNQNGVHDPPEKIYVGSAKVGALAGRFKNHDHIDLFEDDDAVIVVQPVRADDTPALVGEEGHVLEHEETKKIKQLFPNIPFTKADGTSDPLGETPAGGGPRTPRYGGTIGLQNKQWPLGITGQNNHNPGQHNGRRTRKYPMEFVPGANGNGGHLGPPTGGNNPPGYTPPGTTSTTTTTTGN